MTRHLDEQASFFTPFSWPLPLLSATTHFGNHLAHFGLSLATLWITFGSRWLTFGSLLAPFGPLLAHFWCPLAHFWCPFLHFCSPRAQFFHFCCILSSFFVYFWINLSCQIELIPIKTFVIASHYSSLFHEAHAFRFVNVASSSLLKTKRTENFNLIHLNRIYST